MDQSHRTERPHSSHTTLELETRCNAETRSRSHFHISTNSRQRGDDALTFIISAFYAKLIVILGIALPITDAITTNDHRTYDVFHVYYIYLYLGSIVFLLYMYIIRMKEKTAHDIWRRSTDSQEENNNRKNRYVRYGSFYFRMGVIGFGIGSVIYSSLQFGQFFELNPQKDCYNVLKAVKPLLKIIFALMQMLFIFSSSNFLEVPKSKILTRFGLMHMIATNLCEWFFVLVEETQHDIYKSERQVEENFNNNSSLSETDFQFFNSNAFSITREIYEHKIGCLQSNIMEPILNKMESYLGPCTVEYGLLCAVILVLMWKDDKINEDSQESSTPEETEGQSGFNNSYSKRQSQFSVDCAQAQKGLFMGLLILAGTVISLIMFFELVEQNPLQDSAILEINIWEAALFGMGTIATLFCIATLRDIKIVKLKKKLELEHLLLLVTQWGVFIYSLFQIIGAVLMGINKGKGGIMRIISPFSAVIQSSCQTALVVDAWRRRCSTPMQMRLKPGRQLITFLLITNMALWMVNRLKNNRSMFHPNQMDFYGVLAWNIITHVSMPLVVSYRFMASVCFYEIWKHVYKIRPTTNDKEDPSL